MRTIRTEAKKNCTVVICYDHLLVLDSRKTVQYSLYRSMVRDFVWAESIHAYSGCFVQGEYSNHILEKLLVINRDGKIIAELEF